MEQILQVIQNQKAFFYTGATKDYDFRIRSLKALDKSIKKMEPDIYQALWQDLRRSEVDTYLTELKLVREEIKYFIKNLKKLMEPEKAEMPLYTFRSKGELIREPYGQVLILSPWNYPFQLAILPLIGAIAAGNVVILKPSEFSAATTSVLEKLIKATFPPEQVAVLTGGVPETTLILEQPFDYIFFTGSTKVGKIVMEAAARHLTPVTLELGGKSPTIVCRDANLEVSARRIIWGKLVNAGQTCIAPDYLYVDAAIRDAFLEHLIKAIITFYGDYARLSPEYGRIISPGHWHRLVGLLDPDKVVYGGTFEEKERYISPTLMVDVDWEDPIMKEEIFGPILPIMEFTNQEEVISTLQGKPKPLALYLFTEDKRTINEFLQRLSFGGGCINDTIIHIAGETLPFGGVGESGMGSYHRRYSFETFTHRKSVVYKTFSPDPLFRYPPLTDKVKRMKPLI